MESRIRETILEIVPGDGRTVGNQSLFRQVKQRLLEAAGDGHDEAAVNAVREQLIAEGVLGKGRGRGGSVYRKDATPNSPQSTAEPGASASEPRSPSPAGPVAAGSGQYGNY